MKKEITCPHCGDTWKYKLVVDHEDGKSLITDTYGTVEEGQVCTCFKCHKQYTINFPDPDLNMYPFVYRAWRTVKGS